MVKRELIMPQSGPPTRSPHHRYVAAVFDYYKFLRVFREWRYLFLSYSFSEEWLFLSVLSFVSKEWHVSLLGCFVSCWFCSMLTLIIHLYEWMLLSIIHCQKDLYCGGYLFFRISTFTPTLFSKLNFVIFHVFI